MSLEEIKRRLFYESPTGVPTSETCFKSPHVSCDIDLNIIFFKYY